MKGLLPNRLLFQFEFPLHYRKKPAVLEGRTDDWAEAYALPPLALIDGAEPFGRVWAAWSEDGLLVTCNVENKRTSLQCDPRSFWRGDNLQIMTDMRDARTVKRATRFCQHFYFLPTGGGPTGKEPVAGTVKVNRAKDDAPLPPPEAIQVASRVRKTGYSLVGFIPAGALAGFDPQEHPRIGFYYMLEDRDHGQQFLTVGDDLYWNVDPSTWATAVLTQ